MQQLHITHLTTVITATSQCLFNLLVAVQLLS